MNECAPLRATIRAFPPLQPGRAAPLAFLLGLSLLVLGLHLEPALEYRRQAVAEGEWFRLLSASFAHLTPGHAALNLSAAALLWLYAGDMPARFWWFGIIFCSLSVGAGLWRFNPEVSRYVGMSGMLHGMVALIAAFRFLRRGDRLALLLAAGLAAKICLEQWRGSPPGVARLAGGPVIVDAHLWGALAGALLSPALLARMRRRGRR